MRGKDEQDNDVPLTLSLEFVWKAQSKYWEGEIRVFDLYIDDELRYSMHIPERDESEAQAISLPFKKSTRGLSISEAIKNRARGLSESEVNYLSFKNIDTVRKITLQAGIFNKKGGRDLGYTREDVSVNLDVSSLKLGNHYKIIATHGKKRQSPGSSLWQEDKLHAIIEENGPAKKNMAAPHSTHSASFLHTDSPSKTPHNKALLSFKNRKENAKTEQEIAFFTLALDKKYEEAIMYASDMKDQGLGGRLILDLLKYREELKIDVNAMNDNSLKQTPLHRTAINQRWHAYYALVEVGGDSNQVDGREVSAQEYRLRNGMTIFCQQEQQQIRNDLFGQAAPEAKKFVNTANEDCRPS